MEISDDLFKATGSATPINGIPVRTSSGENIIGGGFVKNTDGSVGFIEDVSSYGTQKVQNTIKNRGSLRGNIPNIVSGQEAHHLFPVKLLKENAIVKKAVEGGLDFNGIGNGMALDKYSKATTLGKHGPHPRYTNQIGDHLTWWKDQSSLINGQTIKNADLSPQKTAEYILAVADDLKYTINTTPGRINLIDLGLTH